MKEELLEAIEAARKELLESGVIGEDLFDYLLYCCQHRVLEPTIDAQAVAGCDDES